MNLRTLSLLDTRRIPALAAVLAAAIGLSACSTSPGTSSAGGGPGAGSSSSPSAMFATADVTGLGTVVVDGRSRTVYVLTADGRSNLPCTAASGCTAVWPALPLASGTTTATAGPGLDSALLATMQLGDGKSYPTYNGWVMYEFSGDSGPGQGHGQGVRSFGGTWYAIDAAGHLVTAPAGAGSSTSSPSTSSPSGGYHY